MIHSWIPVQRRRVGHPPTGDERSRLGGRCIQQAQVAPHDAAEQQLVGGVEGAPGRMVRWEQRSGEPLAPHGHPLSRWWLASQPGDLHLAPAQP